MFVPTRSVEGKKNCTKNTLCTGGHHILHELIGHCSMLHRPPVKIFLLYDQKCGQMRQSNIPPLFSRRRSAAYWAEIWPANAVAIVTSISRLPSSYLSVWFSSYFLVYMHFWLFWPTLPQESLQKLQHWHWYFLLVISSAVQIIILIINVWHIGGEPILWKVSLPSSRSSS